MVDRYVHTWDLGAAVHRRLDTADANDFAHSDIDPLPHEVLRGEARTFGPLTAAVATGSQTQQSTYQGRDASGRFRVTQIAVRLEDRWLLVGLHLSPIAQPADAGRP